MTLVVDIAPALTNGDKGLSPCNSNAMTELNGSPVGSAPIFSCTASGPTSSKASASVQTLEIDSIANG
ncbi:hypothetical protein LMG3441_06291 [Achromobacter kerstersii]|uniref:Uncharacterized protein n=1 Tax=Achromobacter kerstersii TaxID=1353890 RepID=A0A6S7CAB5_9BURK|nr:hypothetical protein LMG3441_06291 [Achromobacter kerstersii]